jgi:hypothetical protein
MNVEDNDGGNNQDIPMEEESNVTIPDFSKLSYGTLRRYQAFFALRDEKGGIVHDKHELLNLVKNHFDKFELDSDKVIENFMKIEKDQNNEKNNSLRKSIRFQEKNMARFLDNFSNK